MNDNFSYFNDTVYFLGGRVSLPSSTCRSKLREELQEQLSNGTIDQGETIVPREYSVFRLNENNELVIDRRTVKGREIPLARIRQKLLKRHYLRGLMRKPLDSDERHEIIQHLNRFHIAFKETDETVALKVSKVSAN